MKENIKKNYEKIIKGFLKRYCFSNYFYNYYYKNLRKLIIFSTTNYNFLYINQIYLELKNCNLDHLDKILRIIRSLNIYIYDNIPDKNQLKLQLDYDDYINTSDIKEPLKLKKIKFQYLYLNKVNSFSSNKNYNEKKINKKYKIISKILNKLSSKFFNNFHILKLYFYKNKIKDYFINISQKKNPIKSNLFTNYYNNHEKFNYIKDNLLFNYYILIKKIFYNKNEFFKNKKFVEFLKKFSIVKNLFCNFDLFLINDLFNTFSNFNNKINEVKNKLYDILINLSNITYIKFSFYFNKYGSNTSWVYNLSNLSNLNKKFIKNYKEFLIEQKKSLKSIEKQMAVSIKTFIKLFTFLETLKFKIDVIKEKILNKNLYLVNCVARKYFKSDLYLDYIQEGNIALMDTINKFKYKYINFNNIAFTNIRRYINKFYYKSNKLINLPNNLLIYFKRINKLIKLHFDKFNKIPNAFYISDKLKLSIDIVRKILSYNKECISIESKVSENSEMRYIDYIKDENSFNLDNYIFNDQLKSYLKKSLSNLKINYYKIFCMKYGILDYKKTSIIKIGKKFNISPERVNFIINLVINHINKNEIKKKLIKFIKII